MLSWSFFTHYLLSKRSGALIRVVAWMSMAGMAIGVGALIIVLGVMTGFNDVIRERLLRIEPHLVIQAPAGEKADNWMPRTVDAIRKTVGADLDRLATFSSQDVILKTVDGYFSGAIAKGMDRDGLVDFIQRVEAPDARNADVAAVPSETEAWQLGPDEVLIGSELGEALRLVSGDKLILIAPEVLLLPADEAPPMQTVIVRGFFMSQVADVDTKLLIFNDDLSLRALKSTASREMGVEVRLKKGNEYEKAALNLKTENLKVQTWPERNAAMFFALKMEKLAMTVFLSLSALITSFSILMVLILLISQKRKEIGILMAMGMTRRQTQRIFAELGLWLAFVGVSIGTILGVVVCFVVDRYPMNLLPSIYYDRTIPADVSIWMLAVIFVAAAIIAGVGSWFPAHLSAKLLPAEALRGNNS